MGSNQLVVVLDMFKFNRNINFKRIFKDMSNADDKVHAYSHDCDSRYVYIKI